MTTTVPDQETRTRDAVKACAEWLATCIRIGWRREDLDVLEGLWWKYHDNRGRLITTAPERKD